MSMRPIDIQTIIPKVQNQHNAREVIVHKDANNLQAAQAKNIEESEKKLVTIPKNEKKEHGKVSRDNEKKNSDNKKKKKKRFFLKEENEEDLPEKEKNSKNSTRRNHFDMKI